MKTVLNEGFFVEQIGHYVDVRVDTYIEGRPARFSGNPDSWHEAEESIIEFSIIHPKSERVLKHIQKRLSELEIQEIEELIANEMENEIL